MNARNIFGAICVGIALFFLWPAVFGSWAELQALRDAVREREALVQQRAKILTDAAVEYETYQRILRSDAGTAFSALVPTRKSEAELVSAAGDIAAAAGLQLNAIRVSEAAGVKKSGQYGTLLLSLELTGSYAGLRSFLTNLESYVRLLNVRQLDITTRQQDNNLRFKIDAETYYIN